MKKNKLFYLILCVTLISLKGYAQLNVSVLGSAQILDNNCFLITPAVPTQSGGVWYDNAIDFSNDFTIYYQNYFGSNDANGADGMALVFKRTSDPVIGGSGGGVGYEGITQSMIVEFDTYKNTDRNDPVNDHISIMKNGISNHGTTSNLAGPIQASASSVNIEDGRDHEVKIEWITSTQTFNVYFDCILRLSLTEDLKNTIFGGDSSVYFGFVGSTGGAVNIHRVCFNSISFVDNLTIEDETICEGNDIQVDASIPSGDTYLWSPAEGVSDVDSASTTLSPTVTTTYLVLITDTCGDTSTQSVTINVNDGSTTLFDQIAPICVGDTLNSLPTTSNEGITGVWAPAVDNTSTTTYAFTPDTGQCASDTTMTIVVEQITTTSFTQIDPICEGDTFTFPSTSNEGITGTWSPAIDNTLTTEYTFTTNAGQCTSNATMTVVVEQATTPNFTQLDPICNGNSFTLASTSNEGVSGTWSPAIDTTLTTEYTFTPDAGQCALAATMTVVIEAITAPSFTIIDSVCEGDTINDLPTTSIEGITGTWSPALDNILTTTYTFTPDPNQCASTTNTVITVITNSPSTFNQLAPICEGEALTLPSTSSEGVTGTWSPALDNTLTTEYTFLPTAGQCATEATMTVVVNPTISPVFTAIDPICEGEILNTLPTTSNEGITGAWLPEIDSTQTTTYTFTPDPNQCAVPSNITLIVNPLPSLVSPTPLEVCDDGTPDGLTVLDLRVKDDEIRGGNSNYSISYYLTQSAADAGIDPLPIPYTNISNPQTIFVRAQDVTTGCITTTTLDLGVIQAAVANTPPPMEYCDPDNDGYGSFVLTESDFLITGVVTGVTVSYHETLSDAENGVNTLSSPYNNIVIDTQTIYARVESTTVVTDCATIIDLVLNVYPTPQLLTPTALELCDDNLDEVVQFNLSDRVLELLDGIAFSDVVISFYETEANASSSNNAISTPLAYSNISNPQTVWIRVEYLPGPVTGPGCEKLTSLELIVNPLPVIVQPTPLAICDDALADAFTVFDLTLKNTEITVGDGSLEVVYYTTLVDAEAATNAIVDPTAYTNQAIGIAAANPQTLYARVTDLDTGCFDHTTLTIRVLPNPTPSPDPMDLELCDDTNSGDALEVFDLTTEEIFILNGELGVSATYHETLEDAEAGTNLIIDPETYTNIESPVQTIHVRVTNNLTGCYTLVDFDIIVNPLPNATAVADMIACELNTDDVFDFDLEGQSSLILGGQDPSIFELTYHASLTDAQDGINFLGSPYTNSSDPELIFVSIVNTDTGCRNTQLQFSLEVHEAAQASAPLDTYVLCDDNVETDGDPTNDSVQFDLSTQDVFVLNGQNPLNYTVSYYANQANADQGVNALPILYENGVNPQVIIARVDNDLQVLDATGSLVDSSICYETALVTLKVDSLPIVDIDMDYILCVDTNGTQVLAPLVIDTGLSAIDYTFIWSDAAGAVVGTGSSYAPSQGGNYTLEVFDATLFTQCAAPVEVFTVIESTPPLLTAQVNTAAFASTHVIEAVATGQGIYEYSLDQGPWGDSGMFIDVTPGEHVVTARDLNGCGETQVVVYVIDYPLYFTPNGDGYNDTWNIVGVANQANAKILIFDRYGKLLKQISPSATGWDGTYNGAQLPSSDYWFTLDYSDPATGNPETLRSHFALKR